MRRLIAIVLVLCAALLASCAGGTRRDGRSVPSGSVSDVAASRPISDAASADPGSDAASADPDSGAVPAGPAPDAGAAEAGHVDQDGNGFCDLCGRSVVLYFDFYCINDLHGRFRTGDGIPGVERLTSYLEGASRTGRAVVLSAGDMWQGTSESNLTRGLLVTDWMNRVRVRAMAVGNHEFDFGEDAIRENAALADFPFLALNIRVRGTDRLPDYCRSSVLIDRDGAQIGVIGAIGDCYSSIAADRSRNVRFATGRELTGLVQAEAARLRAAGADFIVYLLHDGYGQSVEGTRDAARKELASYYDTILSDGSVDLVFEGHTHRSYVLRDDRGVCHLQGGGENRGLSRARVAINFANGQTRVEEAAFVPRDAWDRQDEDPIVAELLEKYGTLIAPAYQQLGRNCRRRDGRELRELVARLYLEVGEERWGRDYDLVLGGGYLSVRNPYRLDAGDVTYARLQMLFPFDNRLALCSVKGRDLVSQFFENRNRNYFLCVSPYGERVRDDIDPDATYYLIADTYTSSYAPNRLTVVELYDEGTYARDLLAAYVEAGGLAAVPADSRDAA